MVRSHNVDNNTVETCVPQTGSPKFFRLTGFLIGYRATEQDDKGGNFVRLRVMALKSSFVQTHEIESPII